MELLARSDEQTNLSWAAQLEEVGAHIVYDVAGYKVHAKMAMVVRREQGRLRRYVHVGTGNYHRSTTELYSDFGLMTCHPGVASDVSVLFIELTGLGRPEKLMHLWQAPFTMHKALLEAIRREASHARSGRKSRIVAKMDARARCVPASQGGPPISGYASSSDGFWSTPASSIPTMTVRRMSTFLAQTEWIATCFDISKFVFLC